MSDSQPTEIRNSAVENRSGIRSPAPGRPTAADPAREVGDKGEARTAPAKALYKVSEAMIMLSLGRTVVYELLRSGRLRSVKEGRTRLIPAQAIADYVALLERESAGRAA
jgi:excisionase family DNA binding protein